MRVIAGTARSIPLMAPAGNHTRPTTDKIKETLFNMIAGEIPGCRFLDLYSGSGGIAIEALSRGALEAVLVEYDRKACRVIRNNLEHTHLEDHAEVMCMDVKSASRKLSEQSRKFDIIFLDPPYAKGAVEDLFLSETFQSLLEPKALLILEAEKEIDFSMLLSHGYALLKQKIYKTNQHIFMEWQEEEK